MCELQRYFDIAMPRGVVGWSQSHVGRVHSHLPGLVNEPGGIALTALRGTMSERGHSPSTFFLHLRLAGGGSARPAVVRRDCAQCTDAVPPV